MWGPKYYFLRVEITTWGQSIISKSYKLHCNNKSWQGHFYHFLIFSIWQCHIFNSSATLPCSSKCEDHQGIVLPEKFSHCLGKIIQISYHAKRDVTGSLEWAVMVARRWPLFGVGNLTSPILESHIIHVWYLSLGTLSPNRLVF